MTGPADDRRPPRGNGFARTAGLVAIFAVLAAMAAFVLLTVGEPGGSRKMAEAPAPTASAPPPSTRGAGEEPEIGALDATPELEAAVPDAAAPAVANGGGTGASPNYVTMRVFYATDRKRTGSAEPNAMYGGDRGELVYGTAEVSIPRDHKLGQLEAPSIWRLELREDPERHVVLLKASEAPVDAFYREVAARVAGDAGRSAFVFVHGYNVLFKDAARRTAQMSYDLGFPGAPVLYSWPSQGTTYGYKFDESNVQWTQSSLKRFIRDFSERSTADAIYLVAHSMGNRALTGAVKDLMREAPEVRRKIREIILAAPDIDAEIFKRDIAPFIVTETPSVTLYSSSNDKALKASQEVNGYPRAGDSGQGLVIMPGIDTIDSSDAETDFLGHAYYAESKSIVSDMFQLIHYRKRPDARPALKASEGATGRYWRFVRQP